MRATVLTLATLAFTAPALAATAPAPATASDCAATNNCISAGASAAQASGTSADLAGIFATVSNTLIYIVGAVAVIFLIIGGLRYVISNGDPKAVTAAKDTILYAIIGIVVAILSYAAVNFVISRFITP
jgi:hypothetical protein